MFYCSLALTQYYNEKVLRDEVAQGGPASGGIDLRPLLSRAVKEHYGSSAMCCGKPSVLCTAISSVMSHRTVREPTDEERDQLKRMKRQEVGRVSVRAHIILLSSRGYSAPKIARSRVE
jgi:hypothetical protein